MQIDISVVIPTFRRPRELRDAIASVRSQEGVTVEVLVIDDSPEGGAAEVVASLKDPLVIYRKNPVPTGGVTSTVRNLGWPMARGRFVHFLDDDDMVPPGHYQAVVAAFDKNPNVGLVFGSIEPFGNGPEEQMVHERAFFARAARAAARCGRFGRKLSFAGQMLFGLPLMVCSAGVVRRECIAGVGGFDPEIRLVEDADFHMRVMRRYGACFLDRTVLRYRIGFPSMMHSPNPPPEQVRVQKEGRRRMRIKYRREHGLVEYLGLALYARASRLCMGH